MTEISANSEADVVDAVRAARDWKSPFNIVGARTKRNLGRAVASWGTVLDLSDLKGIVSYEPDELILTVKPGTPVSEVTTLLAEKNQRLGFEPADWGPPLGAPADKGTIGGVIAADVSGSAAVHHGRARDSLLGIRAVNGLGEVYKAGGKVVKNVTGFDLPKLMCGAFGTLGPLTELTLRVVPKSSGSKTLVVRNVSSSEGFAILRRVWMSPLEATGLSFIPQAAAKVFAEAGDFGEGAAFIRLEGAARPLAEKIEALRAVLRGKEFSEVSERDTIFDKVGAGAAFLGTGQDVWRVAVPPTNAAQCVADAGARTWLGDWAGGLLWLAADASQPIHAIAARLGGTATLIRAGDDARARVPVFQPLPDDLMALTRSVKTSFDPLGLFNPGRMYEGV